MKLFMDENDKKKITKYKRKSSYRKQTLSIIEKNVKRNPREENPGSFFDCHSGQKESKKNHEKYGNIKTKQRS